MIREVGCRLALSGNALEDFGSLKQEGELLLIFESAEEYCWDQAGMGTKLPAIDDLIK